MPEVLLRFQAAVLGMGNITGPDDDDMYFWRAGGFSEAQATIALIWSQLGSVKRAQARSALDGFRAQTRIRGNARRCIRGHAYTRIYMSPTGPKRRCNGCERIVGRMKRAAQGIKPRQFKNAARRYNF